MVKVVLLMKKITECYQSNYWNFQFFSIRRLAGGDIKYILNLYSSHFVNMK